MNEEIMEKTPEELMKEFFNSNDLKNMDKESLKHWSNIMTSIVELRKIRKESHTESSMGLWLMLMMMVLPMKGLIDLKTKKETKDEQSIKDGESDLVEEGTQCC